LTPVVTWIVFFILLIATPLLQWFAYRVRNVFQILITTCSFLIWVYTLKGPFEAWHNPQLASVVLILWTSLMPAFIGNKPKTG